MWETHKKSGPASAANTDKANNQLNTSIVYTIFIEIARGSVSHGS